MSRYLWREEYSVGDERIDAQHRKLFELLDELYQAVCAGEGQEAVEPVLNRLLDYTREHFYYEENLLRELGYPLLEEHRREHEQLLAEVRTRLERLRRGDRIPGIELLEFMNHWLSDHILESDQRVSIFADRKREQ